MINKKIRLGDLLVEKEVLKKEDIEEAFNIQKEIRDKLGQNKFLGEILIEEGMVEEDIILKTVAQQLKIDYLEPGSFDIDFTISEKLQLGTLKRSKAIPVRETEEGVEVVFADPLDFNAQEVVQRMMPQKEIMVVVTKKAEVVSLLEKLEQFESQKDIILDVRKEISQTNSIVGKSEEESAIMRLIELIIDTAVTRKSSDIHIEPTENKCRVRARIDGHLTDLFIFDRDIYPPLASRVKLLSDLDIAERRKPQDGRFSKEIKKSEYDFRVSSLPINHGESIVLRILDKQTALIRLDEVGFKPKNAKKFRNAMKQPYGIVFVTGPTGSGKTTTLYAGLNEIKNVTKKLITVEDPIEYQMDLIQQVQVNEKAEMTFAKALRSILRQDPDIIMVGESRDKETLTIAIQAALTGHLVFTTLHTNDAVSAITRVVDMGIEPLLVANAIVAIQAQRLVRKVCKYCQVPHSASDVILEKYADYIEENAKFVKGTGCKRCNNTGYSGRTIISEVLEVTETIAELIIKEASKKEIMEEAMRNDFEPMFLDGITKASQGFTTIEEVMRVAKLDG